MSGSGGAWLRASGTLSESGFSNTSANYTKVFQATGSAGWVQQSGSGSGEATWCTGWSYSGSGTYSYPSSSGTITGLTSATGGKTLDPGEPASVEKDVPPLPDIWNQSLTPLEWASLPKLSKEAWGYILEHGQDSPDNLLSYIRDKLKELNDPKLQDLYQRWQAELERNEKAVSNIDQAQKYVQDLQGKIEIFDKNLSQWLQTAKDADKERAQAAAAVRKEGNQLKDEINQEWRNRREFLTKWEAQLDKLWPKIRIDKPLPGGGYALGATMVKDPNWSPTQEAVRLQFKIDAAKDTTGFRILSDGTPKSLNDEARAKEKALLDKLQRMDEIEKLSPLNRFGYVILDLVLKGKNSKPLLPRMLEELKGIFSWQTLGLMGAFFGANVLTGGTTLAPSIHALGYILFGTAIYDIGEDFVKFVTRTLWGRSEEDLNEAANHLSNGMAKVSTQLAMIWAGGKISNRVKEWKTGKTPKAALETLKKLDTALEEFKNATTSHGAESKEAKAAAEKVAKLIEELPDDMAQKARELLQIAPKKTAWQYATEWHDNRATEIFGEGKGRQSIGGRNYDKTYKGKDVEFKSDNFAKRPRETEELNRMKTQIEKDIANKKAGSADPYWHFDHDPTQAPEMARLLKMLDDAKIPWGVGPKPGF